MKKFLILLSFLLLSFTCQAKTVDFPPLTGPVVDEAKILKKSEKKELESLIESNKNGQIVVAIVKDLRGLEGRDYGLQLARHWKLGSKEKNDGVLIILSKSDRYVGIEVGYGLEGTLTDSIVSRIARYEMMPEFNAQRWYSGLKSGTELVVRILSGENAEKIVPSMDPQLEFLMWVLIIVVLIIFLAIITGNGEVVIDILCAAASIKGGSGYGGGGGSFGGGGFGGKF